ncbi:MAG: EAL domain-containing protein [Candidatus Nitricoxidivorans perseverans]|uniref:EAL domain-containing protein n=1 Tax=Candidatus Nitricoxidivorans perseverans TaxID=2975601 RepID=A0AA49FK76_9PROT|nr:MAG: EAL domain-containing protein [Candidatus Nitricoxidivorans perseverans]
MIPRRIAALWDRLPFTGRLLFTASFALIVAGAVMLHASARQDAEHARANLSRHLADELDVLPFALSESVVVGDFSTLEQMLNRFVRRPNITVIRYRDASGTNLEVRGQPVAPRSPAFFNAWLAGMGLYDMKGEMPVDVGGRRYGVLEIGITAQPAIDRAWIRLLGHLSILGLAILLDFLGIWLVLRAGLKPLRDLDAGAARLASGDYAARIRPRGSPELRRSIVAFNQMARSVEEFLRAVGYEKERLFVTLSSIGDAVIATDGQGRVEFVNIVAEKLTGWAAAEAIGRPLGEVFVVVNERTRQPVECPVIRTLREGVVVGLANHTILVAKDGAERPIADSAAPIRDAGEVVGAVLVFRDQTEERRQINQLQLAASVFQHAHEGIAITDARGRFLEVNPTFCQLTGYGQEEVIGRTPRLLKSGIQGDDFYAGMWRSLLETGHWQGELWNRHKSGGLYAELLTISAVLDEESAISHYIGVFSDITHQKEQQKRLEHVAHYDTLTGLPNRVLLADRMRVALAQADRGGQLLAVAFLDLDSFKPVNDTLGHQAGDRLLTEVASRLSASVRGGDTVARLGGDEFALILSGVSSLEECERTLVRLLRAVADPYVVEGTPVRVSASIGVTLYPKDRGDADALLRHADQAMYLAKEAGRNRYHLYDPEHDRRTRVHRETLTRIEQALAAGQFCLYYQPKVNLRLGVVAGMEALIRWQDPDRGLVAPAEFIPLVDDSELAVPVGEWVIREALARMSAWRRDGLTLPVSVNVSARHLEHPDFVSHLQALLAEHPDLPRGSLELEVLETTALEDIEHVSRIMSDCLALGVGFALDDFGTGYSSLTYFKRLPAQALKIDQSFVRDMLRNPEDLAIVEGIVGLTDAFHRAAIAEGVETEEQGVMLLHLGCELAQGYAIARPMPAPDVAGWIRNWRSDPVWVAAAAVGWRRDDLPLLFAELHHRRWVDQMALLVRGYPLETPPPLDHRDCRFGGWLAREGGIRYGHLPEFRAMLPVHERVHRVAAEALALSRSGQREAAEARLMELFACREELLAALYLLRTVVALG